MEASERKERKMSCGHEHTKFVCFRNLQCSKFFLILAAFVMVFFLIKFQTLSEQCHAPESPHSPLFFVSRAGSNGSNAHQIHKQWNSF